MNEPIKILLIEDNSDHAELFNANLEMTSFSNISPEITDSLDEGVKLLGETKFDLLFLDLSLKDSDITCTLDRIKYLTKICPVVVLTSLDDRKTILDIIQKGADDCLPKSDLSPSLLERCIQFNIDRRQDKERALESMRLILDGLEAVVYVADMETYELLFVNKYVKDQIGDIEGALCWKTLQEDMEGPCPFCTNDKILDHLGKPLGVHNWEYFNPKLRKWFFINDRAIEWVTGKIVRLEIATDMTEKMSMEMRLKELNENLEKQVATEVASRLKAEDEKKMHEAILIQQSRIAAMGEMIGAIAHQWRQPLNAVGLMIQDLKDAYQYGELDEKYLDKVVMMSQKQLQFMSGTIDDFRNFYKPSKEMETFNVAKAIYKAVSLQEAQLKYNFIDIKINPESDGSFSVKGYLNEFKQAVLNIISNAGSAIIEAKKDGVLREKKSEILIDISQKEEIIIINISNKGKNIPVEIIDRVFEPYFTTKSVTEGTGIGLYMTKIIIEKNMSGSICAVNVPDGVTFTIELPAN